MHAVTLQATTISSPYFNRFFFNKQITSLQWFALLLLSAAIVVTKLSGDGGGIYIAPMAFILAGVVSIFSVLAAILMEVSYYIYMYNIMYIISLICPGILCSFMNFS